MKDKERAKKLSKARELIARAEMLITEALPETNYSQELCFSLYKNYVSLESDVAYYKHGEVDPIR
jgi:hypothetical protein